MDEDKVFFGFGCFVFLVWLAIVSTTIFVAGHFILKYW
jgi:heme exporter protein D